MTIFLSQEISIAVTLYTNTGFGQNKSPFVNTFSFLLALPLDPKPETFMFQDKMFNSLLQFGNLNETAHTGARKL